jgi:hypothetical protein
MISFTDNDNLVGETQKLNIILHVCYYYRNITKIIEIVYG